MISPVKWISPALVSSAQEGDEPRVNSDNANNVVFQYIVVSMIISDFLTVKPTSKRPSERQSKQADSMNGLATSIFWRYCAYRYAIALFTFEKLQVFIVLDNALLYGAWFNYYICQVNLLSWYNIEPLGWLLFNWLRNMAYDVASLYGLLILSILEGHSSAGVNEMQRKGERQKQPE